MRFAMATQEKIKSAMADDAHVSLAMAAEENVTGRHGDLTDLRQRHGRRKLVEFATAFAPAPAAHFVPDTSFDMHMRMKKLYIYMRLYIRVNFI